MKMFKSKVFVTMVCVALVFVLGGGIIKSQAAGIEYVTKEETKFNKRIFIGGGWGKRFTATYTGKAKLTFTVKKCKKYTRPITGGDGTDYEAYVYQLCQDINGNYCVLSYATFNRSTSNDVKLKVEFNQRKYGEYYYCISSQKLETDSMGYVESWDIDECKPAYVIPKGLKLVY